MAGGAYNPQGTTNQSGQNAPAAPSFQPNWQVLSQFRSPMQSLYGQGQQYVNQFNQQPAMRQSGIASLMPQQYRAPMPANFYYQPQATQIAGGIPTGKQRIANEAAAAEAARLAALSSAGDSSGGGGWDGGAGGGGDGGGGGGE